MKEETEMVELGIMGVRSANNERFPEMPAPLSQGHFLTKASQIPSSAPLPPVTGFGAYPSAEAVNSTQQPGFLMGTFSGEILKPLDQLNLDH